MVIRDKKNFMLAEWCFGHELSWINQKFHHVFIRVIRVIRALWKSFEFWILSFELFAASHAMTNCSILNLTLKPKKFVVIRDKKIAWVLVTNYRKLIINSIEIFVWFEWFVFYERVLSFECWVLSCSLLRMRWRIAQFWI